MLVSSFFIRKEEKKKRWQIKKEKNKYLKKYIDLVNRSDLRPPSPKITTTTKKSTKMNQISITKTKNFLVGIDKKRQALNIFSWGTIMKCVPLNGLQ